MTFTRLVGVYRADGGLRGVRLDVSGHRRTFGSGTKKPGGAGLVNLQARRAQDGRVQGIHVGMALGHVLQAAAQRLVRSVQRLAQLIMHPRQGTEVIGRRLRVGLEQAVHG